MAQIGNGIHEMAVPHQQLPRLPLVQVQQVQHVRLVIAVDYGTTFTGVAYATPIGYTTQLGEIDVVNDWGAQMGIHDKIPSVYSYSPASPAGEQNWGASLAENAVAMVNTKLRLGLGNVTDELDMIIHALDGMKNLHFQNIKKAGAFPEYPCKGAEEIVTDYLSKVFEYLLLAVAKFSKELRDRIPVDIVVTVPTVWSYDAINSTYRALTKAGFNQNHFPRLADIILITEPEAAAVYTARYLKEQEKDGQDFLKVGEFFILCDAGGGTVDVVSYKVKELSPKLELEEIGIPTGDNCGSIYIDLAFKNWLRKLVGPANYDKLDPGSLGNKISSHAAEGEHMRKLMKAFDRFKREFKKDSRDMKMDLPGPLKHLNLENKEMGKKVEQGEITITKDDMSLFFDPCIKAICDLIEGHIGQIERLKRRTKSLFLIGGFGESIYLQEEVDFSLRLRQITLRRPDTSWTAVVQGAVIHGIEKDKTRSLRTMTTCSKNYGVCLAKPYSEIKNTAKDLVRDPKLKMALAVGQMLWLIKKGDVLLSDQPRTASQVFDLIIEENGKRTGEIPIFSYDDEDTPERFETAQHELQIAYTLTYDLNIPGVSLSNFEKRLGPKRRPYYIATFTIKLSLHANILTAALYLKGRKEPLDREEIPI